MSKAALDGYIEHSRIKTNCVR